MTFCRHGLGSLVPLVGIDIISQYNVFLTDHFYLMMINFCPNESGLFQDDSAYIHSGRGLIECFDEDKNYTKCSHSQLLYVADNGDTCLELE